VIKESIQKVIAGSNLEEKEAAGVMEQIMGGGATPAQIGALLVALRLKGETVEEITGFARVMRNMATRVFSRHPLLLDIVGTGGDGTNTFNISTAAALVAAGAGIPVAKHGNRSVSSKCGSADVLEALGVSLELDAAETGRCLDETGICFLFAQALHGAMKHAAGPRRDIGVRTVFNVLGPLTNPAGAQTLLMGVFSAELVPKLAGVLARLGSERAFVVHGDGGLDEVSLSGRTLVAEVLDGEVRQYYLDPLEYGIARAGSAALSGGVPAENAALVLDILNGKTGPCRDVVIVNAALAIMAAKRDADFKDAIDIAQKSIDSGAALEKLSSLKEFTRNNVRKAAGM
jgi:anthranilate phosphoribosyltransferase